MNSNVTYHQQVSYCGKPRCRKCREGVGHGPYWYAYRTENGRTTRTYIGKQLPADLQEPQERTSSDLDHVALRIRALGQFRLERREGQEWQTIDDAIWQHLRIRALLACLLSSPGRKLGREQIMDMLWPELDMETASNRLDRSVYSLRQLLEPSLSRPATSRFLRMEREGLILADQTQIWVDADAFEHLITQAHAANASGEPEHLLEQAVALYEGDFLPEEKNADWTSTRREVLQRKWMGLLLELADWRIVRGAFASVIDLLDRLLATDPANEAAVQRLIIALAQLDRRGEALRAYHRFAGTLQHDYNIAPLPETRALYEAIQQGDTEVAMTFLLQSQQSRQAAETSGRDRAASAGPSYKVQIGRSHQHPLIGRDSELEVMRQILLASEQGTRAQPASRKHPSSHPLSAQKHPQCILLVGEAGIGKTRLAEELSHEAQKRGWVIAWSRVYAQESSVPYRQWTEALRNAMTHGLWQRQEISKHGLAYQPLSTLLPELHDLLPQEVTFPSPLSPEQEQLRLWEAAHKLLTTISERTPLLMVLDDFHWADASSSELFAYLVRRLHGYPIILIGTYRDNELPASNPLRSLLTDLQREQVVVSLPIQPLTDEQIGSLVSHLPGSMIQYIQTKAAGNPFFAEELARSVASTPTGTIQQVDTGQPLPDTIAAVLELRMSRLSSACQRLLGNASALGGSFTFPILYHMEASGSSNADEDTILDLVEEALQAGVLTEEGTGARISYHFWHPLLVSHLYDQLSAARRARLHRRAADALQRAYQGREEEAAASITHHLVEGGADPQQILHYAELAADRAYTLSAYPEAEKYYRITVAQLDEPLGTVGNQEERLHLAYLLERLGECARIQGNYEEARSIYERVLQVRSYQRTFASREEYQREAQIDAILWREIGLTWYDVGNSMRARQCCERGEQVLQNAGVEAGPAWAMLRFQQSYIDWREGNYTLADSMAKEALHLFESALPDLDCLEMPASRLTGTRRTLAGDPVNLGRTHTLLAAIATTVSRLNDALANLNTALTIFEQNDRQREIANVCCNLGDVYLRKAEHELAQAVFRRSLHLAERVGDMPLVSVVLGNLGVLTSRTGNLSEANVWLKRGIALAEQINDQVYITALNAYLALVLQDEGKLLEVKTCVYRALRMSRSIKIAPYLAMALVALANMRIAQAVNAFEQQVIEDKGVKARQRAKQGQGDRYTRFLIRATVVLKRAYALQEMEAETKTEVQLALANALLLLGELASAEFYAKRTLEETRQYELTWGFARCQRLLGSILAAQGEHEQAGQYFEEAIQLFRKSDMRLEYGRALHSYGISLLQRRSAEKIRYRAGLSYLHEAQQIFSECHAVLDQQVVERELATYEKNV